MMEDATASARPRRFQLAEGRFADASLSALEDAATQWFDGFYQLEHMLAAREWAIRLSGAASPELRFAALVHDAERFFPGGPSSMPQSGFDDPDYLFAHSTRSADIVDQWLDERDEPVAMDFRRRVRALVLRHEIGGNTEEDILQAADSLAFLSTFDWLVVGWVRDGHYSIDGAREKLDWMLGRIRVQAALRYALPFYVAIVSALDNDVAEIDGEIASRRVLAGNRSFLLGLNARGSTAR